MHIPKNQLQALKGIPDQPALACGFDRDEGVIVAYIPFTDAMPEEHEYRDGKRTFTACVYENTLIDMMPHDGKALKWWMVREAARALRVEMVEPIWVGAAEDFVYNALPDVPKPEGRRLAFRSYSRGPWVRLEE